jgi:hypothetical protein
MNFSLDGECRGIGKFTFFILITNSGYEILVTMQDIIMYLVFSCNTKFDVAFLYFILGSRM